jgi:hypothetical protein
MALVDIFCPNAYRETIFGVIASGENRIEVSKNCGNDHRAKNSSSTIFMLCFYSKINILLSEYG